MLGALRWVWVLVASWGRVLGFSWPDLGIWLSCCDLRGVGIIQVSCVTWWFPVFWLLCFGFPVGLGGLVVDLEFDWRVCGLGWVLVAFFESCGLWMLWVDGLMVFGLARWFGW